MGWDTLDHTLITSDDVWQRLVENKPSLAKLEDLVFPLFKKMDRLVGEYIATSKYTFDATEAGAEGHDLSDEEMANLSDEEMAKGGEGDGDDDEVIGGEKQDGSREGSPEWEPFVVHDSDADIAQDKVSPSISLCVLFFESKTLILFCLE